MKPYSSFWVEILVLGTVSFPLYTDVHNFPLSQLGHKPPQDLTYGSHLKMDNVGDISVTISLNMTHFIYFPLILIKPIIRSFIHSTIEVIFGSHFHYEGKE